MIRIFFTFFIAVIFIDCVYSQNRVSVNPIIGIYIYNSENDSKIMGDENFLFQYGLGLNYERENILGYNLQIGYSFLYSKENNTLEFVRTLEGGPEPVGSFYSDVSLYSNNLDFTLQGDISEELSIGFGPSFAFVNRSIEIEEFEDRLASFCLGINGLLQIYIPFSDNSNHWFFAGRLTIRYLHSIWFDDKGRKLDDYSQEYLSSNISVGLGYNF